MLRYTIWIAPLLAVAPRAVFAQAQSARADLKHLFADAQADPKGVVPLIIGASETLGALDTPESVLLADTLDAACRRAFFSGERLPDMQRLGLVMHTVSKGEVAGKIAQHYGIGAGLIRRLNPDFDEKKLRVGQELKVLDLTDGSLKISVIKSRFRLCAWRVLPGGHGRALVACIPVGLGAAESPTPVGRTKITKRVLDPEWTSPVTRQVFAPGDPGNVLGGYWIALDSEGIGKSGIGMHGYTGAAPSNWIEQGASNGCVRMLQSDIDRVFHLALEGTPVEIVP